jgi:hypothetical protein
MDLAPSIWLSSLTGAFFFFAGGRLWNRARRPALLPPAVVDDSAERELHVEQARGDALADKLSLAQQRIAELGTENEALRRDVAKLSIEVGEVTEAPAPPPPLPPPPPARRKAGLKLEEVITARLDELRHRRGSCQSVVLADVRGLLLASCGDAMHEEALAAAASMITEASERMRQILPLGPILELQLTDVNRAVFTARWLRPDDAERFVVGTLGVTRDKPDARADVIDSSIAELLRA